MNGRRDVSDPVEIQRLLAEWAGAVRRKDIEGVLAGRSQDLLLFDVVPPVMARGLEHYGRSWTGAFFLWAGDDAEFVLSDVDVRAGADVAFATGLIHCAGTEDGRTVSYTVRLTVGLEKRAGVWTVVHEHHSEPVSPNSDVRSVQGPLEIPR